MASDFTVSLDIDRQMYREDIAGSIAHAEMLAKQGIISDGDADAITDGLRQIRDEIESGDFKWKPELEGTSTSMLRRVFTS